MANRIADAATLPIVSYPIILIMQIMSSDYLSVDEIGQFPLVNSLLMFFMMSSNWGVFKYIIARKNINKTKLQSAKKHLY